MFYIYVLFLILSGIAMLVMAFIRTGYAKRRQVVNFIFGAGFLIYGLYLLLVFKGGTYFMFLYAFIVPILMIVNFFRDRSAAQAQQTANRPMGQGGFPPPGTPWGGAPGAGTWANGPTPGNGQPNGGNGQPGGGYGQPNGGYGQPSGGYAQPSGNGQGTGNAQPGGYRQGGGYQAGPNGW
jgi:hypothetical protein